MNAKQCGAHAKRTGQPCRAPAVRGRERCRLHGGRSLSGPAHPAYRTGRYTETAGLPADLAARVRAALGDPQLLSNVAEVTLLDARLGQLLSDPDGGESARLWTILRARLDALDGAVAAGDQVGMRVALGDIRSLVRTGAASAERWREIAELVDLRRRLVKDQVRTDLYVRVDTVNDALHRFVADVIGALDPNDAATLDRVRRALDRMRSRHSLGTALEVDSRAV